MTKDYSPYSIDQKSSLSGIPWALTGAGFSATSFMFTKLLGNYSGYSVFEINTYRSISTLLTLLIFAVIKNYSIKTHHFRIHGTRSVFGWIGVMLQTYAITSTAPLPTVQMLSSTSPIFFILILAIFYRYTIPISTWSCLILAVIGITIVLHPNTTQTKDNFPYLLIALLAGLFTSITLLNLKELEQKGEYVWKIVLYYSLFSLLYNVIAINIYHTVIIGIYNIKNLFIVIGLCTSFILAQLCTAKSFMVGEQSITAIFNYSQIIYSWIFSITIFNQPIDNLSLIGIGLVILSGLSINLIKLFNSGMKQNEYTRC